MENIYAKKPPLKLVQKTASGLSGKVKFVRFKNDQNSERSFAIKRPGMISARLMGTEIQANQSALKCYRKNLSIAKKVGNHPNFMKVHGVVVKTVKNETMIKPYLILEHIKGTLLRDIEDLRLTKQQKIKLMNQLKDAFLHLFKLNILPQDLNFGNVIITENNQLKLIDFDVWDENPSKNELGRKLHNAAERIARKLGLALPQLPSQEASLQDLEKSLTPIG